MPYAFTISTRSGRFVAMNRPVGAFHAGVPTSDLFDLIDATSNVGRVVCASSATTPHRTRTATHLPRISTSTADPVQRAEGIRLRLGLEAQSGLHDKVSPPSGARGRRAVAMRRPATR